MPEKPVIGLLGGPGSGKSSVAEIFDQLGAGIVSADAINHQILARPEVTQQAISFWGPEILGSDGQINRQVLGNTVFNDPIQLQRLTDLVHPLIRLESDVQIEELKSDNSTKAIVLDIPLLLETDQQKTCDFLVFVECEREIRLQRVRQSRGWDDEKLSQVEKMQISLEIKAQKADYIISNNQSLRETAEQAERVFVEVLNQFLP